MQSGTQKHNNNTSGQETDKGQDPDAGKPGSVQRAEPGAPAADMHS